MSNDSNPGRLHSDNNCLICTSALTVEEDYKYLSLHKISICDGCAKLASSAYEAWHGPCEPYYQERNGKPRKRKISATKRFEIFKRDGFKCLECQSDEELSLDHIIPESKGGDDSMGNLRTLCRTCNSRKGAKLPEEMIYQMV